MARRLALSRIMTPAHLALGAAVFITSAAAEGLRVWRATAPGYVGCMTNAEIDEHLPDEPGERGPSAGRVPSAVAGR
jgi:hypothetical protein